MRAPPRPVLAWAVLASLTAALVLVSCSGGEARSTPEVESPRPIPRLDAGDVGLVEIAGPSSGLEDPRDLAFDPRRPGDLWVVSDDVGAVVIVHDATGPSPTTERRRDAAAAHFLHRASSIAFGADETTFGIPGTFATCGESRNENGLEGSEDFMGPVLWSSDPSVFARQNPRGLGSHLDMLHESPLCMGIAHERDNVYWVVTGATGAITRYDFGEDHGVGMDDHRDGSAWEYARGTIGYVPGVPSHLVMGPEAMLYVADPGHGRVIRLDTTSGRVGAQLPAPERLRGGHPRIDGAHVTDLVAPGYLARPSGIELHDGALWVSDAATGRITAFSTRGERLAELDTGLGPDALAGIAFGPDGRLYLVERLGSRVLRVELR